ncbi:MAG: nucleotidyltransferase domain-containing protein [Methanothrix sp.]|nr:nucleotidyltransferase domain-containing protein [Methanothrix sp.]
MDKNETLERIRNIVSEFEEVDLAYVFGSFPEREDFHDIDVAIHLSKERSPYQRFKLSQKIARSLEQGIQPRVDFDVRILNYAPAYFQYEVISKGVVVLERDREERVDYEAHLTSEYLDLKYMYDRLDRAFLARA